MSDECVDTDGIDGIDEDEEEQADVNGNEAVAVAVAEES